MNNKYDYINIITASIFLILLLNSCASVKMGKTINIKKEIPDFYKIKLGKIANTDNELMYIYKSNEVIGLYERFDNPKYAVKSVRVHSISSGLLYKIQPTASLLSLDISANKVKLHILNNKNVSGLISVGVDTDSSGNWIMVSDIDFYQKSYELTLIFETPRFIQYTLKFNGVSVMAFNYEKNKINPETGIFIDKRFYHANPDDAVFWIIAILLIDYIYIHESY